MENKKNKEEKLSGYCQICTTLPVDDRPKGQECSTCGKFACNDHGAWASFKWCCTGCA